MIIQPKIFHFRSLDILCYMGSIHNNYIHIQHYFPCRKNYPPFYPNILSEICPIRWSCFWSKIFLPGPWLLQRPPEAQISLSVTSIGYQILAEDPDTVCCSKMNLGGVTQVFPKWIELLYVRLLARNRIVHHCFFIFTEATVRVHNIKIGWFLGNKV